MLAVHLAHVTKNPKIGWAVNIAPMWHPLRLAEDFATADILTGGRTILGVGRGYHTREVETFGAPMLNQEASRKLFEEQVEIIFKAFNEESFSHQGKHYTLPPRVSLPRLRAREADPGRGIKGAVGGGAATMQAGRLPAIATPRLARVRNSRSARTSSSVCTSTSPKPASRRSARSPRSTRSA